MLPNAAYTATQAARILNVKRRVILDWGEKRFVAADVQQAAGRGTRNIYSATNLVQLAIVREAFASGLRRAEVETFLVFIQAKNFESRLDPALPKKPGTTWLLFFPGEGWQLQWRRDGAVSLSADRLQRCTRFVAINLDNIKREVAARG